VNGLAVEYQGRIDLHRLNAKNEGKAVFDYYHLPGHPAYVLLLPGNVRVWSDVGIKTREQIAAQLDAAIKR
jgi:hypothetical protein